jgi:hypothetical protein
MKSSIRKFVVFFFTFVLIIGSVVGAFWLIGYAGTNQNSVASGSTATSSNDIVAALVNQGRVTSDTSATATSSASGSEGSPLLTGVPTTTRTPSPSPQSTKAPTAPSRLPIRMTTPKTTTANQTKMNEPQSFTLILLSNLVTTLGNMLSFKKELDSEASSSQAASDQSLMPIAMTPSTSTTDITSTPSQAPILYPAAPTFTPTPTSTPIIVATTTSQQASVATTTDVGTTSTTTLMTIVAPALALPYTVMNINDMSPWERSWGAVAIQPSADGATTVLSIGATSSTTGGEAFLLHSDAWTNYMATVALTWPKGETFTLVARYHEGKNNVSCEFLNTGGIFINSTIDGRRTLLGQGMVNGFNRTQPITASIQVNGDRVQCGLNGSIVNDYLYYGLPQNLLSGGFDVETWDPQMGNAQILLNSISVTPL